MIICFNQDGTISSLNGKPLKLEDKFIYLYSNSSSTESGVTIHIGRGVYDVMAKVPNCSLEVSEFRLIPLGKA